MSSLQGKVANITGAAQGMGLETARELARRGAVAVLADVNEEKLGAAAESVSSAGKATSYVLDVSKKDQWLSVVSRVHSEFGCVDILINNAAIFTVKPFEDIPEEESRLCGEREGRVVRMSGGLTDHAKAEVGTHYQHGVAGGKDRRTADRRALFSHQGRRHLHVEVVCGGARARQGDSGT